MDQIYAQLIEIAGGNVLSYSVDLVDHQMKGLARCPEVSHQRFITRLQACAAVNKQQHNIRFGNGGHRLACHGRIDTRFLAGDATGVDDNEPGILNAPLSVLSIPRQTGKVGNQCIPTAG